MHLSELAQSLRLRPSKISGMPTPSVIAEDGSIAPLDIDCGAFAGLLAIARDVSPHSKVDIRFQDHASFNLR